MLALTVPMKHYVTLLCTIFSSEYMHTHDQCNYGIIMYHTYVTDLHSRFKSIYHSKALLLKSNVHGSANLLIICYAALTQSITILYYQIAFLACTIKESIAVIMCLQI